MSALRHARPAPGARPTRERRTERSQGPSAADPLAPSTRAVLDAVGDGVAILGPRGQPIYSNPAAKELLGVEIRGMPPAEWSAYYGCFRTDTVTPYPPEDLPAARALRGEIVESEEIFIRHPRKPDGLWLVVSARPWVAEGRNVAGAAVIFRDNSRRRTLQAILRDTNDRFQHFVRNVRDYAIYMLDAEGRVITWNPGAERMTGWGSEEVLGRHFGCFFPADDVDAGNPGRQLGVAAEQGAFEEEAWRVRKDGTRFWARVSLTALRDEFGTLRGFAKVTRDLTERRAAELALRKKNEELDRANQELSLFAYTASHELQEPLRKILAFGDLLKRRASGVADPETLSLVGRMQDAAGRMQRLVDDILELSRTTTNSAPLATVALSGVLQEVAADFENRLQAAGARLEIGLLPTVQADVRQMRQLFTNLISNAYKFRRPDAPLLISVSSRADGAGFVDIRVQDNGIGFEQGYAERIFKPFQRLHRRGDYEGTGMGLAICDRIVLRHGGKISAQSEPGKGSTFFITLPA